MTERTVQVEAVKELRKRGYLVIDTSNNRRGRRAVKGMPDVFVAAGRGLWTGIEFKAPRGNLTPEQERLMAQGNIHIARTTLDAILAVQYSERQLARTIE